MSFKDKYPELFQFFAGYFPTADYEGLTDEEVVSNYLDDCNKSERSKEELEKAKIELAHLIINLETYWIEIGEEANRYFNSKEETLFWLEMIQKRLGK